MLRLTVPGIERFRVPPTAQMAEQNLSTVTMHEIHKLLMAANSYINHIKHTTQTSEARKETVKIKKTQSTTLCIGTTTRHSTS